jgi:hypothetical protein
LIDLRNLTQEMLEAALPNMGICEYTAPCIIGALVCPKDRMVLRGWGGGVVGAVDEGIAALPEGQLDDAEALQRAFDREDEAKVRQIAAKYIGAPA